MLVITYEQMDLLDEFIYKEFVEDAYDDIVADYPELGVRPQELKPLIYKQGKRAMNEYNLTTVKWIFHFVVLSLKHNILLQNPYPSQVESILKNDRHTENAKIELLKMFLK